MNSTIKDIAKLTGVSVTTVSRVINNTGYISIKTKEKVLAAIKKCNYTPNLIARALKTDNKFIGVISHDITNPYFSYVVYGIEKRLREDGYTMFHLNSDNQLKIEEKNIEVLLSTRVEGIILLSSLCKSGNIFIEKAKKSTQLVSIEGGLNDIDSVNTDNLNGTNNAINFLIGNGHKNIGICSSNLNVNSWKIRYDAYKNILQEKGIYNEEYDFIGKDFIDKFKNKFKEKHLPTALFALHDSNALLLYNFCYENNLKIPEDISIIGFDDLPISKLIYPRLTTIAQPFEEIGIAATELLLNKIKNKSIKSVKSIIISTELMVRESVKNIEK